MRMIFRWLAAAVAVFSLTLAGPVLAQQEVRNPPDPYVHAATGIAFPVKLGDFTRGRVAEYDAGRRDVSVNYHQTVANSPTTFTLYLYPAQGACADEFAGALAAIGEYEGVRRLDEERTATMPGFDGAEQHFARFLIPPGTYGFDHPQLMSEAWLACAANGRWLVKLRGSYEARHADAAQALADQLLAEIDWAAAVN